MGASKTHKARVLVLFGSLRETSFSRQLAFECARLLELMGADVRVFNPSGLPLRDPTLEDHPKVGWRLTRRLRFRLGPLPLRPAAADPASGMPQCEQQLGCKPTWEDRITNP